MFFKKKKKQMEENAANVTEQKKEDSEQSTEQKIGQSEAQTKNQEQKSQEAFEQDLSGAAVRPGMVFMMQLLMKEPCQMPEKEYMTSIMQKHLKNVECFCHDDKVAGFLAKNYIAHFKDADMPPQLMITSCNAFDGEKMTEFERSQMWDCQESDRILTECKYQVLATDMLAATLTARERADMLMDYLEALVEIYPDCEAVYFQNSGKLFTADQIRNHSIPRENRFIYFAVNARFFNIQNSDSMIVDTVGMSTLYLPDLQYHFQGMDPNWVVNHAYNVAAYLLAQDNPIKQGDSIDGIVDGRMNQTLQWKCHYEQALIQPVREVIDIFMNEYAAGTREYEA